jgi:DNA mismatch repair protein MutS2
MHTGLGATGDEPLDPVDWRFAKPGDPVRILGGGSGVLLALPDRRGRCKVQIGAARVLVPGERVGAAEAPSRARSKTPAARHISVESQPQPPGAPASSVDAGRCDLRGLRVDEALDRLVYALDRAASAGRHRLVIVHGLGSGALRDAVRRHLAESPYATRFAPGAPEEGGDGVTTAEL